VHVLLQADGPEDEQPLDRPGDLRVQWLHGGARSRLADALRVARVAGGRRARVRPRRGELGARPAPPPASPSAACRASRSRSPATGSASAPRRLARGQAGVEPLVEADLTAA
jgi:hypothetical protein